MIEIQQLELVVFDFDGVLTDNKVWVMQDGSEAVVCNRSDGLAFDFFRKRHLPTLILSTETNPVVTARAQKLQTEVFQAVHDKGSALKEYCERKGIDLGKVLFVGNDINDLSALSVVGFPVAVQDAHPLVLQKVKYILPVKGGEGAARSVVEHLLDLESALQSSVNSR